MFRKLIILLVISALCAGCTGVEQKTEKPSYNISPEGLLMLTVPVPDISSSVLTSQGNITVEKLTMKTFGGDVNALLISPVHPSKALVWAPGAGVPASGHINHTQVLAEAGIAVLVVDVRGNGGETPGTPLNIDQDFNTFNEGNWPQYYLIVSDIKEAKDYLKSRFGNIPVYSVGESNGGRYAAVAAEDSGFAGYVGISTSGMGREGDTYNEPARQFLLSIDPDVAVRAIEPRPIYIFHAPADPVIPFEQGKKLATTAGSGAKFFPFNGTHGVNGEVDSILVSELADH